MFQLKTLSKLTAAPKSLDVRTLLRVMPNAAQNLDSRGYAHEMPEKLKDVPTAENPRFFDMVEYFFHRACQIAEDKLVEGMKGKMSIEDKKKKVRGILMGMQPCDHIIEIAFPVRRDSGDYEMITGYRAQHSTHRTPCKGGEFRHPDLCSQYVFICCLCKCMVSRLSCDGL